MKIMLTADWHLRDDQPPCRINDFMETQQLLLQAIAMTIGKFGVSQVYHSGDLFHKSKPSPRLLSWTIRALSDFGFPHLTVCPGNHDLPYHSWDQVDRSGLSVLEAADVISIAGRNEYPIRSSNDCKIYMVHEFVYKGKEPWKNCGAYSIQKFIKKMDPLIGNMSEGDIVLIGDNHQSFQHKYKGIRFVNPGCISIQRESERNIHPSVYVYCTESRELVRHLLPSGQDDMVKSTTKTDPGQYIDDRLNMFVESLTEDYEIGLSFEDNIKKFVKDNKIEDKVYKQIRKAIYDE